MFTDDSAWELIAEKLAAGHPYEDVLLDVPAGNRAIVLHINLPGETSSLYIKVEIGFANCPIGRSFHLSYKQGTNNGSNLYH